MRFAECAPTHGSGGCRTGACASRRSRSGEAWGCRGYWFKGIYRPPNSNLRVSRGQKSLIDRAAQALGRNQSDFMLETACREAESVLLDRRYFALSDEQFKRFTAMLDKPPASNPRLERLLKTKAPWDRRVPGNSESIHQKSYPPSMICRNFTAANRRSMGGREGEPSKTKRGVPPGRTSLA